MAPQPIRIASDYVGREGQILQAFVDRWTLPPMEMVQAKDSALFLDLDGTLVDIATTPDRIRVPADLVPLLARLSVALGGALGIITGRSLADIDCFLAPLRLVGAGVHGAEFRTEVDGQIRSIAEPLAPSVIEAVSKLVSFDRGIIIEPKRCSIAVHYRLAPAAGPRLEAALRRILMGGPDHLILCQGRKVIEVVPRHVSKGAALDRLLQLPAFHGRRPIMIGDDVSDQSALELAARRDGQGLRVAGEHFGRKEADFDGPAHVRAWLSTLAELLES